MDSELDKIELNIERLGVHGEGVGYLDGYTVFVEGALPGEKIQARLIQQKKTYGKAELIAVDQKSPDRVQPICPVAGKCGGCQVMHLDYPAQLEMKRQRVVDAFVRIAKMPDLQIQPCVASPSSLYYRNKIQAPIRPSEKGVKIGFNRRNSHNLVEVETCYIHCALGQKVYDAAVKELKASGISAYDWKTGKGELRYLIIKTAVNTGQALVVFVTQGNARKQLTAMAQKIRKKCPEVQGVIHNINTRAQNVVLGNRYELLDGSETMEEEILGLRFRVSAASFFQVNPHQAALLYEKAFAFSDLQGDETVLDAYCGVGTLSLLFAREAKKVVGVECVSQAVDDARKNAELNRIENVRFVCAQAEKWIQDSDPVDLVLLNPPRKGCDPALLHALGKAKPSRIVYVSCDPATLARDLAILAELGYCVDEVQPVDMFPQTAHVETIAKISYYSNCLIV